MNIVIKPPKLLNPQIINVNNRIGNKIISTEQIKVKDINMNGAIHSIKIENEYFTNFVKSYDKKIYIQLKALLDDIFYKRATIDDRFILLNNDMQNPEKQERLNRIIRESLTIQVVPSLMKLQPKTPKDDKTLDEVRIYIFYNKNIEEFELYLIDIYHLGIDAFNHKIRKYDLKGRYRSNETYKKCISKLADDYRG